MKGMKKKVLAFVAAAVLMVPQMVGAEGFAIYEWSAEGMGMAGARMFAENDAANLAYNPASITKVKGEAFKVSATYLSPHGKYDVDGIPGLTNNESGHNRVHPAWAPGMYYVKQINDKEWFGMGTWSRFGMVSQFERDSLPGSNSFSAKLNGITLGANYAHKFDKKWAASLGAEVNYVGLQMDKNARCPLLPGDVRGPLHVEGESYALGWNAAANYAFDEKNEVGLVYRSKINHSMEADYDAHGWLSAPTSPYGFAGDAYACVSLPESLTLGYNHKFNDKTRVELNYIWTRWERYNGLDIAFTPNGGAGSFVVEQPKNWTNGKRFAIGLEHKFSDKYSGMLGYAFDHSNIPYDGGDFMIPTGTRSTYSIGAQYHDKKQTLAVALGWMNVGSLDFKGNPAHGDAFTSAHTRDSYTKMASISYQRNF